MEHQPVPPLGGGGHPLIIEELAGLRPAPEAAEGFRFQPRLPDKLKHFTLQAPFQGRVLRVDWKDGEAALAVLPRREKGE